MGLPINYLPSYYVWHDTATVFFYYYENRFDLQGPELTAVVNAIYSMGLSVRIRKRRYG